MNIELGQVVYSKVGRDAGRKFIISYMENRDYVLVVDGDLRRVEKPKRKKIKHLNFTDEVIASLSEKLKTGLKVTNSEVRRALAVEKSKLNDINVQI